MNDNMNYLVIDVLLLFFQLGGRTLIISLSPSHSLTFLAIEKEMVLTSSDAHVKKAFQHEGPLDLSASAMTVA